MSAYCPVCEGVGRGDREQALEAERDEARAAVDLVRASRDAFSERADRAEAACAALRAALEETWRALCLASGSPVDPPGGNTSVGKALAANAGSGWAKLWVCERCAFGFDASHVLADGTLECPCCAEERYERALKDIREGEHSRSCQDAQRDIGMHVATCPVDIARAALRPATDGGDAT